MNIFFIILGILIIMSFVTFFVIIIYSQDEKSYSMACRMRNIAKSAQNEINEENLEMVIERIKEVAAQGDFSMTLSNDVLNEAEINYLKKEGFKIKIYYPDLEWGFAIAGFIEIRW